MDITTSDVHLLIRYASEKGKEIPADALPFITPLPDKQHYSHEQILRAHSALSRETMPITSDSLKDSDNVFAHTKSVLIWTILIALMILTTEVLSSHYQNQSQSIADGGMLRWIYQYVLIKLSPFLWGGLGSCIFILKKISDLTSDRLFRSSAFHGTGIRIVLGAILGGVINDVVSIDTGTQVEAIENVAHNSVNTLAFLTGLSVKVVYGGLEKLIDTIVDKFSLNRLSSSASKPVTLMTLAAEKLQKLDENKPEDAQLKKTLQDLIGQL